MNCAVDTARGEKLRGFIFRWCPQPFDTAVFAQYITGTTGRQQEGSLIGSGAGPDLMDGL
jgi:hypothetical protein